MLLISMKLEFRFDTAEAGLAHAMTIYLMPGSKATLGEGHGITRSGLLPYRRREVRSKKHRWEVSAGIKV